MDDIQGPRLFLTIPAVRIAQYFGYNYSPPMLAKLHTFSLLGIDALPVEVEVDVSPGALPKTVLVGLPEQAVKESTHRIERAMVNSGFVRPQDRCVINLAPARLLP
jgi:magnesium chelatase family protein